MTPSPTAPDRTAAERLQAELQRLYLPRPPTPGGAVPAGACAAAALSLIDADGGVRALVVQVAQPPGWDALAPVWRGVQTDLDLPAPAVAVSGIDALQLWFSLAQPVPVAQAQALLQALRQRYLPDIEARRLMLWPADHALLQAPEEQAIGLPVRQVRAGQWSAFVAPDLAPVFAETPWLEGPPNDEGQATLLRGLDCITPAALAQAQARLTPAEAPVPASAEPSAAGTQAVQSVQAAQAARTAGDAARHFLLDVMNDASAPLALRIEAARSLLQSGR